jgi:hypothetical protein
MGIKSSIIKDPTAAVGEVEVDAAICAYYLL